MIFSTLKFILIMPLKIVCLPIVLIINFTDCYDWEDYWNGIKEWFEM